MQMIILASFVIAMGVEPLWQAPPWALASGVCAYLLVGALLSATNTLLGRRALRKTTDGSVPGALRRNRTLALLTPGWMLGGLAGLMLAGLQDSLIGRFHLGSVPLSGLVVAISPFAAVLVVTWLAEYPFYALLRRQAASLEVSSDRGRRPGWTLGEFLGYNMRHQFLFFAVPIGLIVLIRDSLLLYVHPLLPADLADAVVASGFLVSGGAVFLIAPLLLVRIWRTRRLEDGPMRDQLETLCARMELRYRDILVWRTGGMIANAAVMGIVAPFRYVLLSDALLENMDRRAVRAVFAHEAGHIVFHHILHAVVFVVASSLLLESVAVVLAGVTDFDDRTMLVIFVAMLVPTWGIGFGRLSRLFERQSDVFAAWSVGGDENRGPDDERVTAEGAATFAWALQRIAQLNGIPARRPNWRHGSIASRVAFILTLGSMGGSRKDIDRKVRRVKLLLWAALLASVAVTIMYAGCT